MSGGDLFAGLEDLLEVCSEVVGRYVLGEGGLVELVLLG